MATKEKKPKIIDDTTYVEKMKDNIKALFDQQHDLLEVKRRLRRERFREIAIVRARYKKRSAGVDKDIENIKIAIVALLGSKKRYTILRSKYTGAKLRRQEEALKAQMLAEKQQQQSTAETKEKQSEVTQNGKT